MTEEELAALRAELCNRVRVSKLLTEGSSNSPGMRSFYRGRATAFQTVLDLLDRTTTDVPGL